MEKEDMKKLVAYLNDKGHNVIYDENPSKEKVERINEFVTKFRNRKIEG